MNRSIVLFVLLVPLFLGCADRSQDARTTAKPVAAKKDDSATWWCQEHGVPEQLCSLCSDEVAAKLKKQGDWCEIHDRAKSQCFKCDPSKYKQFEDMYVARYNRKPEPPEKAEFEK